MKRSILFFAAALLIVALGSTAMATTYYGATGTTPTAVANWGTTSGGGGTHPTNFTTAGDIFIIENGTTMTATATWLVGSAAATTNTSTLEIDGGGTLAMSTYLLTLASCNFTNAGTYSGSGGVTISGTGTTISINGFTTTGTTTMTKTAGTATFTGNVSGAALTINGTGGTLNLGAGLTHTFTGVVTLTAGTLNGGSSTINENATSTTAWGGTGTNFTPGTGTVVFGGAAQTLSATGTKTFNNLTFKGSGVKTCATTTVNGVLTMSGSATASALPTYGASASIQYDGSTESATPAELPTATTTIPVTYTGNSNVTVTGGGPYYMGSLTINSGSTLNWERALTVTGATNITGTVNWSSSSTTSRAEAFTGDVTLNSGAVWTEPATGNGANNTYGFAGNFTNDATTFNALGTGVHTFSGAGKTISGSTYTSIPSVTFSGTYTNSGTLIVTTALAQSGTGALTNGDGATGTLKINFTGTPGIGAAHLTATASGNTVGYGYAGTQTLLAIPYYNLTLAGSGAKTTPSGTLTVGDIWNVSAPAALNTNNTSVTVTSDVIGTGSITSGSGTITVGGAWSNNGTFTAGTGTVTFNGASQAIPNLSFNNLTLSGSGTKTPAGTLTVGGNLDNSVILDMAGNTLSVTGTKTNTGGTIKFFGATNGVAIGSGTVEYDGVSPTVAGGTYYNLSLEQNSGDAQLGGSSIVNGTLKLGGNILLGTSNLTLGGTVTGGSAGMCVVTNGSGYVSRDIANAGSFSFPIGPSTTTYNPVTMNNNTGSTYTYTAQVAVGDNPTTPDNTQAGNQTWTLTGTAAGGSGVDLFFTWLTSEAGVSVTPASAVAWYYNGTAWVQAGGTTSTGTPNVTSVPAVTSLSPWIIGNPNALPVEVASLTAKAVSNNVNVEWTTVSETNTLGFYVERASSKTGPFTAVNSVIIAGAGTSLAQHNYSYADNSVSSGTYYYRLHEVDKDGKGSYSNVITVTVANVLGVREEEGVPTMFKLQQNYPNPFNPTTDIKFWIKDAAFTTLKVYNSLGQEVASLVNGMMQPGRYVATWNADASPSGAYFYRLASGSNVSVQRMLMLK